MTEKQRGLPTRSPQSRFFLRLSPSSAADRIASASERACFISFYVSYDFVIERAIASRRSIRSERRIVHVGLSSLRAQTKKEERKRAAESAARDVKVSCSRFRELAAKSRFSRKVAVHAPQDKRTTIDVIFRGAGRAKQTLRRRGVVGIFTALRFQ